MRSKEQASRVGHCVTAGRTRTVQVHVHKPRVRRVDEARSAAASAEVIGNGNCALRFAKKGDSLQCPLLS